jgi:hypothetical protein
MAQITALLSRKSGVSAPHSDVAWAVRALPASGALPESLRRMADDGRSPRTNILFPDDANTPPHSGRVDSTRHHRAGSRTGAGPSADDFKAQRQLNPLPEYVMDRDDIYRIKNAPSRPWWYFWADPQQVMKKSWKSCPNGIS